MKQPMANLLEYHLGRSVFSVFMEHLDGYKGNKKRKPNFFSYRRWDQNPVLGLNTTRMSMVWGGCPGLTSPPTCGPLMGLGSFNAVEGLIGPPPTGTAAAAEGDTSSTPTFPTLLLADHMVWRHTTNITQLVDDVAMFNKSSPSRCPSTSPPLIVWHHGPTPCNTADGSRATAPSLVRENSGERSPVAVPERMAYDCRAKYTSFAFGKGSFECTMCLKECATQDTTGKGTSLHCLQSTWGDDVVILAWLNAWFTTPSEARGIYRRKKWRMNGERNLCNVIPYEPLNKFPQNKSAFVYSFPVVHCFKMNVEKTTTAN